MIEATGIRHGPMQTGRFSDNGHALIRVAVSVSRGSMEWMMNVILVSPRLRLP